MMNSCTEIRELFSLHLEGELEEQQRALVHDHVSGCDECRELLETMKEIVGAGLWMELVEPPDGLDEELSSSPCRLWLGLLFQAVDREISQHNLERLLTHLEACPSCRSTWQDMTLIHQVSDAMEPSQYLLNLCLGARTRPAKVRPILNRRMATAAAYFLAVLTSLVIGNPVTLARSETVGRVATVVTTEVEQVAEQGRGEARIALWRIWKWGEKKVDAVRDFVGGSDKEAQSETDSSNGEQGETL